MAADHSDPRDVISLARLVEVLLRRRWHVATVTLAFSLLGLGYALVARPVYQADLMIQLDDGAAASSAWSLLGDAASLFDVKSSPGAETQIIGSRLVVQRAVEALHLDIEAAPSRLPVIGDLLARWRTTPGDTAEAIDVVRFDVPHALEGEVFVLTMQSATAWQLEGPGLAVPLRGEVAIERAVLSRDGEIRLKVTGCSCRPGAEFTLVRQSRHKTVAAVREKLVVKEPARQSGVLVATLSWPDPDRVRALLHEIGEQYVAQNVARKSAEAAQSLAFLEKQLPDLKRQLEIAQGRYTSMTAQEGIVDLTEEARIALKTAAETQNQLLWLKQKKQELATRFTGEHPSLKAVERQVAVVRGKQQDLDRMVRQLPELQRRTAQLTLDVRVATDLYTSLLASAQQLELMKAGRVASARVVDLAVAAEDPVAPDRLRVVLIAMLAGLIAGAGTALALDWIARTVGEPGEVEQILGLSVLGIVPNSAQQHRVSAMDAGNDGVRLLASVAPSDPAVESLRSLRTALQLSGLGPERNVLLMTGGEPGAGKTFAVANLAAVLASAGQRVLLVDGDMRRGTLHRIFRRPVAPGLADALGDVARASSFVQREVLHNVDLLCQGNSHANVGELLAVADFGACIAALRGHYDIVLIDTPPVPVAADAAALARHADIVLLVARMNHSRLADLEATCKRLHMCGITPYGVILNGFQPRLGSYGYRHGGYYHRDAASGPARIAAKSGRFWSLWRKGRRT